MFNPNHRIIIIILSSLFFLLQMSFAFSPFGIHVPMSDGQDEQTKGRTLASPDILPQFNVMLIFIGPDSHRAAETELIVRMRKDIGGCPEPLEPIYISILNIFDEDPIRGVVFPFNQVPMRGFSSRQIPLKANLSP